MSSQIDYRQFSHGESCTEEGCRSRKWYIEDGKKFCQRGHEQAGFTQTQQDDDDWNSQGKKVRRKREEKERAQTVLSGREAQDLYLQCYQLVLWKQAWWLVNEKGFPDELETVIRDLWCLRLRILHDYGGGRDGFGSGVSVVGLSDTSDGETGSGATGGRSLWSRRSRRIVAEKNEKLPRLVETLALCYLGTLLMKLPVSLGEIFKWAANEQMIFTRAIKEVPKDMRAKLPAHFHSALEIRAPLKGSGIYSAVLELVGFYHLHFELVFPVLNIPLLLFKHTRDLGLPIEIYRAVQLLVSLLELDFNWPVLQKGAYRTIAYPEIRLMSLIVIATKLSQPLDDTIRHPEAESDLSTVQINWANWAQTMIRISSGGLKRGEEINVTDADVLGMSETAIDDYLDWSQKNWASDRVPKVAEQILELFPLQDAYQSRVEKSDQEEQIDDLKQIQNNAILRRSKPIEGDDYQPVARAGECYRRYRTAEELPKEARAFYEIAAKNIGVDAQRLVRGVFQIEVQLEKWNLADRRRQLSV